MAPSAGDGRLGERSTAGVKDLRVPGLISPPAKQWS